MAHYILVHGAFQGGFVWDGIAERLRAQGHSVDTPDLPSLGQDSTPVATITLDAYVERVRARLEAAPRPSVLVGHSLAGMVISQAAEYRPDLIARLVYVAAFLLRDGECPKSFYDATGAPSPVMQNSDISADGIVTLRPGTLGPMACQLSPPEAVAAIEARLRPMARKPLGTPLKLSAERYGRVPKTYLVALHDLAVPTRYQEQMIAAQTVDKVVRLDCDHSPMFSAPDALVAELLAAAAP